MREKWKPQEFEMSQVLQLSRNIALSKALLIYLTYYLYFIFLIK